MAITPEDILACATAVDVMHSGTSEIEVRNAASRAYYALLHKADQFIKENRIPLIHTANAGTHEEIIRTLASFSVKGKVIADNMVKLKKFRTVCDYKLYAMVPPLKASHHIREAERFIGMVDRLQ